jgi:hypothetical protein
MVCMFGRAAIPRMVWRKEIRRDGWKTGEDEADKAAYVKAQRAYLTVML